MSDKRSKMYGVSVSKGQVIASLGRPSAEWARLERRLEFQKRLVNGETELGIKGIRGYGFARSQGYLGVLRQHLVIPPGVGTGLVPDAEDERIRETVLEETRAEIAKYEALLAELERSPDAVATYVGRLRWWLEYKLGEELLEPDKEVDEEMAEMARQSNKEHLAEITSLTQTIRQYEALLQKLQATSQS